VAPVTTEKLRIALAKSFSSLGVPVGDREKPGAENGRRQGFLIYYDFGDLWKHQIRFEGIQAIREKKIYMEQIDHARHIFQVLRLPRLLRK
jgi:hypothetical protein